MDKNGEKLLRILSGELSRAGQEGCPSVEDISALIDGRIRNEKREKIERHIASCDVCYETYVTAAGILNSAAVPKFRIFSPWSIAATVLIALVSFVIFYKVTVEERGAGKIIPDPGQNHVVVKEDSQEKKRERPAPAALKTAGKSSDKKIIQKRPELKTNEFVPIPDEEESGVKKTDTPRKRTAAGSALQNVQGIPQAGNKPVQSPAVISVETREALSGNQEKKESMVGRKQKKGGKGLVDRLSENEKIEPKADDFNCFRKEGDDYHRYERFGTVIKLEENPPEVLYKVHPKDTGSFKDVGSRDIITIEVFTDEQGTVEKACLLAGESGNTGIIIKAVKEWKFAAEGGKPARFRLVLALTREGIIEILNAE